MRRRLPHIPCWHKTRRYSARHFLLRLECTAARDRLPLPFAEVAPKSLDMRRPTARTRMSADD